MNIVLRRPDGREYYLVAVRKDDGRYVTQGKCIRAVGGLRGRGCSFIYASLAEAERKCRILARTKVKRRGYKRIQLEQLPEHIVPFLEPPPETQLTTKEAIELLKETRRERYVVFKDVSGLEEYFDADVEYLARQTRNKETIAIYDRFGELRNIFKERLASIEPTERCL